MTPCFRVDVVKSLGKNQRDFDTSTQTYPGNKPLVSHKTELGSNMFGPILVGNQGIWQIFVVFTLAAGRLGNRNAKNCRDFESVDACSWKSAVFNGFNAQWRNGFPEVAIVLA